jgi:S1-C subfamily serine protease
MTMRMTALLILQAFAVVAASAQRTPDAQQIGRNATAVIVNSFTSEDANGAQVEVHRGSGFCITKSGYFITNAHVLQGPFTVRMGIQSGPHEMRFFDGTPVDIDRKRDLALIRVDEPLDFKPIRFADTARIQEGARVLSLGFPAQGNDIDAALADNWVTVHSGRILHLFRDGGGLSAIAVNTGMWQGASGGPVLNDRGELVGVVQKGQLHTKLNLAISSNVVAKYLVQPKIAALVSGPRIRSNAPSSLTAAGAAAAQRFTGKVIPGLDPIAPSELELELSAFGREPRRVHGVIRADGSYTFQVPILTDVGRPHTLRLTVFKTRGGVGSTVASDDFTVQVGGRSVRMSEVCRIDIAAAASAMTLWSGEILHGPVAGLDHVPIRSQGASRPSDLSGAVRLLVQDSAVLPSSVQYTLSVRRKSGLSTVVTGHVSIAGLPKRQLGQGMVIACGSAWATNNTGRGVGRADALSPSTRRYIRNIMDVFAGGAPANVLIYTDHWAFGEPFREVLKALGHTVTVTFEPGPLQQYDVIFIGGHEADQKALADYVNQGGKVYWAGGSDAQGGFWNTFLGSFGLYSKADAQREPASGSDFHYPPLFDGVSALTLTRPYQIVRTEADRPDTQTICNQSETNLWAIYRASDKLAPSPAQFAVIAARHAAEAQKARELQNAIDHRTVDAVKTGDENSERAHNLQGENLISGRYDGRPWRAAIKNGNVSYTLKVDGRSVNYLLYSVAWTAGDAGECTVYVDNKRIGDIDLYVPSIRPGRMRFGLVGLPHDMTEGKESVVVRFQAENGGTTPELFQCEIQRAVQGFRQTIPPTLQEEMIPRAGFPTVDAVKTGNAESERAHNVQGENTRGEPDRQRRAASDGGWFSYTMKVDPQKPMAVSVEYSAADGDGHAFDILIDGVKLVSVSLHQRYQGVGSYICTYPIPESWTKNKTQIVVRFSGHPGNMAGSIYRCNTTER